MTASNSDGSQTAVISTEHTLGTITSAGTYQLQVDLSNLANKDTVVLKTKLKVRSTGTTRLIYEDSYTHAQSSLVAVTIPVAATNEVVYTLTQTAGTGRAFPWEIVQLDG
jgi:hypothetical protein